MAYRTANLLLDQGSTFSTTITGYDVDGNLLNLTGYSARAKIKANYSTGTSLVDFTTSIQSGAAYVSGLVDLSLTSTQTAALAANDWRYDVEVYSGTNVTRIQQGLIRVNPEITR
ncbi:MAG: hypothetical protein CME35_00955 [Gramella sp.]|nr:hypothetical protein [Christiangramia sp.]|tara:strand:+ start:1600 stop:1944 length:345 start_codon:yes stop_codon:yes gene_type:complete